MNYNYILDIKKLENSYLKIRKRTKHKQKLLKYELFYSSNLINLLNKLKNKTYKHGKYNIFIIKDPKIRVIMSENMEDKIINHLISNYILFPIIEPKLINTNVATRENKGSKEGINYLKKYINKLKDKYSKIYILKCDITKYFYSIDHQILLDKLKKFNLDDNIFEIIKDIVCSTNHSYINDDLKKIIFKMKIDKVPTYVDGKGLPIGNMSSQILAIFYLNDLDHYIKEKLKIKYYIRYMDDFILIHHSKEYLEYCKNKINEKIIQLKLELNKKTQICEIHNGIVFLGYRFILKNKKLYTLISPKNKRNIKKKITKEPNKGIFLKERYFSYLKECKCNNFLYNICNLNVNPKRLTRYRKSGIILMNGGENMVKIRLKRMGTTKRPFYRIVVADSRSPRDGRSIEEIGTYNPVANPAEVKIDKELAIKWLKNGAEPTDTVRNLLSQNGILKEYHEMRMGK